MNDDTQWIVYIVQCSDIRGSLYIGITNNIEKRLKAHNSGNGARYTKNKRPITLLKIINCANKSEALKLEYRLKQLTRQQKLELIKKYDTN